VSPLLRLVITARIPFGYGTVMKGRSVVTAPVAIVATAVVTKYAAIRAIRVVQIQGLVMLIAVPVVRPVVIKHVVTRQLRSVVMT